MSTKIEKNGPSPTIRFRCPRQWVEALEKIAKDQRRELPELCRIIVEDYLEQQEALLASPPSSTKRRKKEPGQSA